MSEDPSPFPSWVGGKALSGLWGGFLGPVSGAQPWTRQPISPSGPSPAPRAPAQELAPDAVAIETSSPHKNHGNKKEAPEMMGPSPAELWTWARSSTLSHPRTQTWGHGCLQRPGSTWGGWERSPSKVAAPSPPSAWQARVLSSSSGEHGPSEGVCQLCQAKPSPSPQKTGPSLPGSPEDPFPPRSQAPKKSGGDSPIGPWGRGVHSPGGGGSPQLHTATRPAPTHPL